MTQYYLAFLGFLLFIWTIQVHGCHNALDGGSRRKRDTNSNMDPVERTRNLRIFFSNCMMERAGPLFDWDGVVDFSILDTLWYDVTNEQSCSNDTVLCWQNRLEAYLRPNSNLLPFARECIEQVGDRRNHTARRQKRSYYQPSPTPSQEDILMDRYAACVRSRLVIPRNRRRINVNSVVEFIEENAICGECSRITERTHSPYGSHGRTSVGRSKRSTHQSSSAYSSATSTRSLASSLSSSFVQVNLTASAETGCVSSQVFPFVFQALTLSTSPLLNPVESCNQIFRQQFLPNPCEGLTNRKTGHSFCERQQSWCDNFPEYMNRNCEKTCCERRNMLTDEVPNIGWTTWTPWGACPAPCGRTAVQVRKRSCPLGVPGVAPCVGEARETRICEPTGCSFWSNWSPYTPCSVSCGLQTQFSRRTCVNGQIGQNGCIGNHNRVQMCNRGKCPGSWSIWGSWSKCSVSCGGVDTYIYRRRTCNGGRVGSLGCEGSDRIRRECGRQYCPQEARWAEWSSWSDCTWKKRVRHCEGGPPGSCQGDDVVYERCYGCSGQTHAPASWMSWSQWSSCEGNCVFAVQRRTRVCQNERRGSSRCYGQNSENKRCNPLGCYLFGK